MHGREKKSVAKKQSNTPSIVSSPTGKGASPYHSYGALDELGDHTQFDSILEALQSDKKAKGLEATGAILGFLRALDDSTRYGFGMHGVKIMAAIESIFNTNKKANIKDKVVMLRTGTLLACTHGDDLSELYDSWSDICFQSVAGAAASSNLRSQIGAVCFESLALMSACNPESTVQIGGSGNQGRGGSIAEGLLDLVVRRGYMAALSDVGKETVVYPSLSSIPSGAIAASVPTLFVTYFGGGVGGKDVTNNTNDPDENQDGAATSGGIATGAAASSAAAAAAAALLTEGSPSDLSFTAFLKCLALACEASHAKKVCAILEGAIGHFVGLNPLPSVVPNEFPEPHHQVTPSISSVTAALIVGALEAAAILGSRFPQLFVAHPTPSNPTSGANSAPSTPSVASETDSLLLPFNKFTISIEGLTSLKKLTATHGPSIGKTNKRLLSKAIRSLQTYFPDAETEPVDEDDADEENTNVWNEEDAKSENEDSDAEDDDDDATPDGHVIKIKFRKSKAVLITGYHRCVLTQLFRGVMEGGFHRHITHNTTLHRVLRPSQAGLLDDDTTTESFKDRKSRMIQQQTATKRATDKERSRFRDAKQQQDNDV